MAESVKIQSMEEIEARHAALTKRAARVQADKATVEAELTARRRELKRLMDEARAEGLDPSNLREEVQRLQTVLSVKMDAMEAELNEAERILKPMLESISKD